ncbi:hypothetical protein L195_g062220, partial [Trifolium pratense]
DYMYRVGTAHADFAISFVSSFERTEFNMIERLIGEECMLCLCFAILKNKSVGK